MQCNGGASMTSNATAVDDGRDLQISESDRDKETVGDTESLHSLEVVGSYGLDIETQPANHWLSKSCDRIRCSWFVQEVIVLLNLAIPIILSLLFQQSLLFISLLFVGHITGSSLELDAAGLGLSFGNVSGLTVAIGLASAADTLSSQAYGFGNYKRVGVILQRGILILSVSMFPVFVVWLNSEGIALLLQQEPCVARLMGQYLKVFCFGLPGIFLYQVLLRYLQTQGIVWALVIVGILTNLIFVALNAIFIFVADLGLIGASLALSLSMTSSPLLVLCYMRFRRPPKQTWGGWSWESLEGWWQYIKLGVPGLLMLCCEMWTFEIAAFVAGSIDETQLGINSIIMGLQMVIYMVPLGMGVAAGIRVGNELGAGQPLKAKRASFTATVISVCFAVITCVVLLVTRNMIGTLFTKDQGVIDGVAVAMYVVAPVNIPDGVQGTIAGVLRGSGRQVIASLINFLSYYVVGLPLGIVLALVADMGTFGLWTGLFVGDCIQAVLYVSILLLTNWEHQSKKAIKNAQDHNTSQTEEEEEDKKSVSTASTTSLPGSESDLDLGHLVFSENEEAHNLSGRTGYPTSTANGVIEEIPLMPTDEEELETEDNIAIAKTTPSRLSWVSAWCTRSHLRLLLSKSSFFVVGIALLVAGGVVSHYTSSSASLDCYEHNSTDNSTVPLVSPSAVTSMYITDHLYIIPSPIPQ